MPCKLYRTRIGFKIVYSPHSSKYAINHSYSRESSWYVATYLSKDDNKTHLLKVSALSAPEKEINNYCFIKCKLRLMYLYKDEYAIKRLRKATVGIVL